VVAYLALFVALGGSSYAAIRVGSRQIVDNSVRSKDIRDNGVRGRDVKEATLATVPLAASAAHADSAANADTALGVADNAINGGKVADNSLNGNDILESQLGTVPLATSALSAQDIADDVVTGAKVAPDALTGADIDESTLAGVDASSVGGVSSTQIVHRLLFGTIGNPVTFDIPHFGQLTTECGAANTEWHYVNNTGLSQELMMDTGGNDAVYKQIGNTGTQDSGNNGALAPAAERIIWQTFGMTVITMSVRTGPSACRMSGIAYAAES
jgi:hypothetical protein